MFFCMHCSVKYYNYFYPYGGDLVQEITSVPAVCVFFFLSFNMNVTLCFFKLDFTI